MQVCRSGRCRNTVPACPANCNRTMCFRISQRCRWLNFIGFVPDFTSMARDPPRPCPCDQTCAHTNLAADPFLCVTVGGDMCNYTKLRKLALIYVHSNLCSCLFCAWCGLQACRRCFCFPVKSVILVLGDYVNSGIRPS